MAINLKSTKGLHANGVKCLVYGHAGSGKTSLIPTLPAPVALSAEGGLLSISGADVPYIEIASMANLMEAYTWLTESAEAQAFESVALDSISEIAEVVLAEELKRNKDGRAAYGELNTVMAQMIRAFRDLPGRNVYFTAKCEKAQDETGRMLYSPMMPGKSLSQNLGYFFDLMIQHHAMLGGSICRNLIQSRPRATGCAPTPLKDQEKSPAAPYAVVRRKNLSAAFPNKRLIVPAGTFKVRTNDSDYRFRPHTAYSWLS